MQANASHPQLPQPFLDELLTALAGQGVQTSDSILAGHAGDWSEATRLPPLAVIHPRSPAQVAAVLAVCNRHGQRVVVQGGLTGLAGGATPQPGEIALSLARLKAVEPFDKVGGTVTVEAGIVLEELQQLVEREGWFLPLDLGARGSCQVGGNAATNAGGNRVIRYGTMRELVLGLEVALPDGRLVTMLNRLTKNTTGLDLKHLFIGSEGTLGVITRLVLKLSPKPTASCTALCALPSFDAAARLARDLRRSLPSLSAFELMWSDYMAASLEVTQLRPPFAEPAPVYALVEVMEADEDRCRAQLESALGLAMEAGDVGDAIVAQSLDHARSLWEYREAIGEILSRMKPYAALDVGVPMAAMDGFVASVREELERSFPAGRHLFFGHLGDGNLHVLSGPHADAHDVHEVERRVYERVAQVRGTISAEHGIGVVKKEFLGLTRSEEEIALMRELKRLFDPAGILNAARVF